MRCGEEVSESSSTGRNAVALRHCHAERAPGALAFLLAGQCTRSQCIHSEKSTILSLLQRTHEFKGRCVKNKISRIQQSMVLTFITYLYYNWSLCLFLNTILLSEIILVLTTSK